MPTRSKLIGRMHEVLVPFTRMPMTVDEALVVLKEEFGIDTIKPNVANAIFRAKKQGVRVDKIGHNAHTHFYIPRKELQTFYDPVWKQITVIMDMGDWFTCKELAQLLDITEPTVRKQLYIIKHRHKYPLCSRRKGPGTTLEYSIAVENNEEV